MNKVLLVEDSRTINKLLSKTMEDAGIDVVSCHSAQEAIGHLTQDALSIRLVVTDLIMDGQDGYDLIDHIHQTSQSGVRPRIIAISGGSAGTVDAQTAVLTVQNRVEKVLKKPFSPQDLLSQVTSQLNAYRALT